VRYPHGVKTHRTISDLARDAGIPSSTIRYYERSGLLRPSGRTEGNYRYYDDGALGRLRFIRAAQATGFTLANISTLLGFRDGNTGACNEVKQLIESRLSEVDERLHEFERFKEILTSYVDACREVEQGGECPVIEDLDHASIPPGPTNR
jgi:DNA-binding transcriptional MerR regulator